MTPSRVALWLAGHRGRLETERARKSVRDEREAVFGRLSADEGQYAAESARRGKAAHLVLGSDAGVLYRLTLHDFRSMFIRITGATNARKTTLAVGLLEQLLSVAWLSPDRNYPLEVVVLEKKGDLVDRAKRIAAKLVQQLPPARHETVLARVQNLRFFGETWLPPWNILSHTGSALSIMARAHVLAEALETASESPLGGRQAPALTFLLALAIELGMTVNELRICLSDTAALGRLGAQSSLPEVRLYVTTRLARERGQADALAARLDAILRVPALRAVLAAPSRAPLLTGVPGTLTLLDLSGGPFGSEAASRALGLLVFEALVERIFDPSRPKGTHVVCLLDEVQQTVAGSSAAAGFLERLVTTGRAFGANACFIHQVGAQLPSALNEVLDANTALRLIGRGGILPRQEADWLPRTGRVERPMMSGERGATVDFLSDSEEARYWANRVANLAPGTFLVSERGSPFAPRIVEAQVVHVPTDEEIDPAILATIERGSVSVPAHELIERAAAIETVAAEKLTTRVTYRSEAAEPPTPRRTRRHEVPPVGPPPSFPDAVAIARRWPRPRGLVL